MALSRCKAFCLSKVLGWGVTAVALTSSPLHSTALASDGAIGQSSSLSTVWNMAEAHSWASQGGRSHKKISPGEAPLHQENWLNVEERPAKSDRDWGVWVDYQSPSNDVPDLIAFNFSIPLPLRPGTRSQAEVGW